MLLQALLLTLAVLEEEGLAEEVGSCGEGVGALPEAVAAAGVGVAASGREAEGLAECERGLDAGPVGSALDVWGTVLELEGKGLPLGEREAVGLPLSKAEGLAVRVSGEKVGAMEPGLDPEGELDWLGEGGTLSLQEVKADVLREGVRDGLRLGLGECVEEREAKRVREELKDAVLLSEAEGDLVKMLEDGEALLEGCRDGEGRAENDEDQVYPGAR